MTRMAARFNDRYRILSQKVYILHALLFPKLHTAHGCPSFNSLHVEAGAHKREERLAAIYPNVKCGTMHNQKTSILECFGKRPFTSW